MGTITIIKRIKKLVSMKNSLARNMNMKSILLLKIPVKQINLLAPYLRLVNDQFLSDRMMIKIMS